jgi:hydrogenase maturation protease
MSEGAPLLVAGVGNIFMGDDAFGVEVVRRLRGLGPLPDAEVTDFGIRGFDLGCALDRSEAAIVVDAVSRGGAPGTLYLLEPEALAAAAPFEPHALTPDRVLGWLGRRQRPRRLRLVGCEPATLELDQEGRLSSAVDRAADEAVALVQSLVRQWSRERREGV